MYEVYKNAFDLGYAKLCVLENLEEEIGMPLFWFIQLIKRNKIDVWNDEKWVRDIPVKRVDIVAGLIICENDEEYKISDYEQKWRV